MKKLQHGLFGGSDLFSRRRFLVVECIALPEHAIGVPLNAFVVSGPSQPLGCPAAVLVIELNSTESAIQFSRNYGCGAASEEGVENHVTRH